MMRRTRPNLVNLFHNREMKASGGDSSMTIPKLIGGCVIFSLLIGLVFPDMDKRPKSSSNGMSFVSHMNFDSNNHIVLNPGSLKEGNERKEN